MLLEWAREHWVDLVSVIEEARQALDVWPNNLTTTKSSICCQRFVPRCDTLIEFHYSPSLSSLWTFCKSFRFHFIISKFFKFFQFFRFSQFSNFSNFVQDFPNCFHFFKQNLLSNCLPPSSIRVFKSNHLICFDISRCGLCGGVEAYTTWVSTIFSWFVLNQNTYFLYLLPVWTSLTQSNTPN